MKGDFLNLAQGFLVVKGNRDDPPGERGRDALPRAPGIYVDMRRRTRGSAPHVCYRPSNSNSYSIFDRCWSKAACTGETGELRPPRLHLPSPEGVEDEDD
jgi:hypothetical protein